MVSFRSSALIVIVTVLLASGGAAAGGIVSDVSSSSTGIDRAGGPFGTALDTAGEQPQGAAVPAVQEDDETDATNETIRHRHVDDVEDSGSEEQLENWLFGQLTNSVENSTELLRDGEYEDADAILDEQFDERVEQYRQVSGRDDAAEEIARVAMDQRELIELIDQYDRTLQEYEEAREAGNDEQARQLARELESIQSEIDEQSIQSIESHQNASTVTDHDFSGQSETVGDVTDDIADTQESIRTTEFESTTIVANTDSPESSFLDPLEIDGEVTTENGTTPSDGNVLVQIDNRTVTTPIEDDGTFTMEYRPAMLEANATQVEVEYGPEVGSAYINSTTTVPIAPERVEPDIQITEHPDSISFDESITIGGSVQADEIPADGVPIIVSIGGQQIGEQVHTDDEGRFVVDGEVPADVPAGEQAIEVSYPETDRALIQTTETVPVSIEETETQLEFQVERTQEGQSEATFEVSGTLFTALEEPLNEQSVTLLINGNPVTTAQTDMQGEFDTTIELDNEVGPEEETVRVAVAYEDESTNLGDNRGEVEVDTRPLTERLVPFESSIIWWILAGATVFLGIGVAIVVRTTGIAPPWQNGSMESDVRPNLGLRLLGLDVRSDDATKGTDSSTPEGDSDSTSTDPQRASPEKPRGTIGIPLPEPMARERLATGDTDAATVLAYELTRANLDTTSLPERSRTHWEFYDDWIDMDTENADALRRLTQSYEKAEFAPLSISRDETETAIQLSTELVGEERHSQSTLTVSPE